MAGNFICDQSRCGCYTEIQNLKQSSKDQWDKMDKLDEKYGSILTRVNVLLGSVALALLLLAANLVFK